MLKKVNLKKQQKKLQNIVLFQLYVGEFVLKKNNVKENVFWG
jgi:hypothetical protein